MEEPKKVWEAVDDSHHLVDQGWIVPDQTYVPNQLPRNHIEDIFNRAVNRILWCSESKPMPSFQSHL